MFLLGSFRLSLVGFIPIRTGGHLKGFPDFTLFWNSDISLSGWIHYFGPYGWYLLDYYLYVCKWNLSLEDLAMIYFFLTVSNGHIFKSFKNRDVIITFTHSCFHLLYIYELLLDNRAQVSQYTLITAMWDICRSAFKNV